MKKMTAIMTAIALTTSNVFAAGAVRGVEIQNIEMTQTYAKTVKEGTFKSFEDGMMILNDGKRDFAINTDAKTVFVNSNAEKFDILTAKAGTEFEIIADTAQTRSIPPQSYGYVVIEKTAEKTPIYVEAAEINGSDITSADNEYIIRITDTTEIVSFATGSKLTPSDVKKDSQILVYSDIMTMSIPAQVPADKIVVLNAEDVYVETEQTVSTYGKTVKTGTFKSFEDEQMILNDGKRDFAINTDAKTVFVNSNAEKFDILTAKAGTEFEIIADTAQTRSIPPQSYGYVVIEKTAEKTPIYVEAAEINGSDITSADNEYIIRITDTTEIVSFATGKKLAASDVKKDSQMLVYSDIMTMSIPAQVPADKIVVLDTADEQQVSKENVIYYLQRLIEALGFGDMFRK